MKNKNRYLSDFQPINLLSSQIEFMNLFHKV